MSKKMQKMALEIISKRKKAPLLEVGADEGVTMEPPFDHKVESAGPDLSDNRDNTDSGQSEKPEVPENVDKGSPEVSLPGLSEDEFAHLRDIIAMHKARYSKE